MEETVSRNVYIYPRNNIFSFKSEKIKQSTKFTTGYKNNTNIIYKRRLAINNA